MFQMTVYDSMKIRTIEYRNKFNLSLIYCLESMREYKWFIFQCEVVVSRAGFYVTASRKMLLYRNSD
jgi:hypothetical protein